MINGGVMFENIIGTIIGTSFEHFTFLYVMYRLLRFNPQNRWKYVVLGFAWNALSIFSIYYIPAYAMFVNFPLILGIITLLSEETFFKVFFTFLGFALLIMLIQLPMIVVYHLIQNSILGILLVSIMVLIVFLMILSRWEADIKYHIEKYENKYINYLTFNVVLFVFLFKIIYDFDNAILLENFPYFLVLMVLMLSLNFFIYREVARISERSKLLEVQDSLREPLDLLIEGVKASQHEYRNHLNTILGILETSDSNAAVERIKNYLKDLKREEVFEESLIHIDRDVVRATLFMKNTEAAVKNIDFQIKTESGLNQIKLLDYELSIVLNNLINNAFEAVYNHNEPDVIFEMGFDEIEKRFYCLTKNDAEHLRANDLFKLSDKHYSTKLDEKNHGFGLWNVKNIVKKNGGHLTFCFEGKKLVVKVLF